MMEDFLRILLVLFLVAMCIGVEVNGRHYGCSGRACVRLEWGSETHR